jgi:hypothetical protein
MQFIMATDAFGHWALSVSFQDSNIGHCLCRFKILRDDDFMALTVRFSACQQIMLS